MRTESRTFSDERRKFLPLSGVKERLKERVVVSGCPSGKPSPEI
jgi:hypothetical protein